MSSNLDVHKIGAGQMQFVSGKDTLKSVAEFLKSEDVEIALAVAFWGGDAMKRLGVAEWKAKNVRMICNATSGACNPLALKDLRSHIGSNLRTNPNLHAKVYWTPRHSLSHQQMHQRQVCPLRVKK